MASSDSHADSIAGSFTKGPGVSSASFATHDLARITAGNLSPATGDASVTANAYYAFTLSLGEDVTLNLASLSFDAAFYGTDSNVSANYKAVYFVRSSLDGYAANIGSEATRVYQYPGTGSPPPTTMPTHAVDLSDSLFQGIAGSVTFRIYLYDYNGVSPGNALTSNNRLIALDNVILEGAVTSVPEPSAFAAILGGAALAATCGLRRFRQKR